MAKVDPYNTPALSPPPGVISNFVDPETTFPILVATSIICIFFTSFVTAARLVLKLTGVTSTHREDYAAFTAWAGFVAYTGVQVWVGHLGQGRHQWDVTLASFTDLLLMLNVIEILYGPVIFVAKLTILLQFIRIFCPSKSGVIYQCIRGLIWGNLIFYLVDTLVLAFACTPRRKINHPEVPGHCVNTEVDFVITGAWNVFSDVSILLLPLSSIWNLQVATKRKLGLSAVFATGLFACIASIIRLVYSVEMFHIIDTTYIVCKVAMWSCAEMTTIILAGSLPVLPRFFRLLFGKLKLSTHGSRSKSSHHSQDRITNTFNSGKTSNPSSKTPWREPHDSTWRFDDSYLPLKEAAAVHHGATKAEITGGRRKYPTESGDISLSDIDVESGLDDGIRKTVRIETSQS